MADVLITDLDERTFRRLSKQAERNGRSLEAEVRQILEVSAQFDPDEARALIDEIREKLSGRQHSDSAELIAEDRAR